MKIKIYDFLPREAMEIREKVFVEEQGFLEEFDEIDSYAAHLVLFDQDEPIAACRFFQEKEKQDYIVGRIAVIKEYRGQKIGVKVLRAAEEEICRRILPFLRRTSSSAARKTLTENRGQSFTGCRRGDSPEKRQDPSASCTA